MYPGDEVTVDYGSEYWQDVGVPPEEYSVWNGVVRKWHPACVIVIFFFSKWTDDFAKAWFFSIF
jgi:hypothetical protein